MRIFLFLGAISSIFLLNGCTSFSQKKPVQLNYSSGYTQELNKFKEYQKCMNKYILREIKCSYFYRSGEDIIRNTQVKKCIKEKFPNGSKSCGQP